MITTASDLAATFGGTTKEAVEALGSAFKGEFDPLEKYGVSLKASTVTTEAMAVANVKTAAAFSALTVEQQAAARRQATLEPDQQAVRRLGGGRCSRETDTLAHKQQVLAAQVENVKTKVRHGAAPGHVEARWLHLGRGCSQGREVHQADGERPR